MEEGSLNVPFTDLYLYRGSVTAKRASDGPGLHAFPLAYCV